MSGGAKLGVEAFSYGIDKGYDRIPNTIFLTPKERKQRREQERVQQGSSQSPDTYGSQNQQSPQPRSGQGYSSPGGAYGQDSYSQDRGFDTRTDRAPPGQEDSRQALEPYWNSDPRGERSSPMQGDPYNPPGSGSRRAYNPSDYEPRYNDYGDGYGRDQYGMSSPRDPYNRPASAGRVDRYRPQSYQGGSYADSYDDYDDYDRRSSRRSRSSKSKSQRSRSRSGIRGQLDKRFDKTEQGLTSGALGALAGGLVGHEVGKGPLATVAGVVLGGLGANAFEAHHERRKSKKDMPPFDGRRAKSTDARGGGYEKDDYYGRSRSSRGGGRDRGYDGYDSYDNDDGSRSPQRLTGTERKEKRRAQREEDESNEAMERHFNWGNTFRS